MSARNPMGTRLLAILLFLALILTACESHPVLPSPVWIDMDYDRGDESRCPDPKCGARGAEGDSTYSWPLELKDARPIVCDPYPEVGSHLACRPGPWGGE